MKTILGIDIGTSGTKTILVDDQGRVIAANRQTKSQPRDLNADRF